MIAPHLITEAIEGQHTMIGNAPNPECCSDPAILCPKCKAAAGVNNTTTKRTGIRPQGLDDMLLNERKEAASTADKPAFDPQKRTGLKRQSVEDLIANER